MRHIGFSAEKEKGDYSFRNPRIEGDLGRKVEKIVIGTPIARRQKNGGVCEPISAPLFMRGEPTHRSFFAAISCDKNRNLCDISAEKRE